LGGKRRERGDQQKDDESRIKTILHGAKNGNWSKPSPYAE
jgi:hypothetical protein